MLIALDPGVSAPPGGTGYAIFGDRLLPEKTGILTSRKPTWEERASHICVQLVDVINEAFHEYGGRLRGPMAYIELPTLFLSTKGMACAAGRGKDSDLVKLSVLVGMLSTTAARMGLKVKLVPVNEWKGNLPKNIVTQRVARRLNKTPKTLGFTSHAIDAVGIGLYAKGVFKANAVTEQPVLPHVRRRGVNLHTGGKLLPKTGRRRFNTKPSRKH